MKHLNSSVNEISMRKKHENKIAPQIYLPNILILFSNVWIC